MFHGWVLIFALSLTAAPQQAPAPMSYELAAAQVAGAKRYSAEDVTRLSGLVIGQPIAAADLQAAADHLAASGLFKQVQYRYVTAARRMTVIFEFEEAEWTVPVTFDNFIWFPDDEIIAAVRRDVPSFDGTAPATEGVPDLIIGALQKLLEQRSLPGTVGIVPQVDLKSSSLRYLFAVKDPAPRVCSISVNGASRDRQADLLEATKPVIGRNYSRFSIIGMAEGTLLDIYHHHGHWSAAFGAPLATVSAADCQGVNVALQVTEGPAYAWAGARWSGNAAIPAADLDRLLGLRVGEVADGSKIRDGLMRISKAYGRLGHVTTDVESSPRLDPEGKRAVFEMTVNEGPQFRMGTLAFVGLSDGDAEALRRAWKLPPGAVYDAAYPDDFQAKEISPRRSGGKRPIMEMQIDRTRAVVNIRFVFQ